MCNGNAAQKYINQLRKVNPAFSISLEKCGVRLTTTCIPGPHDRVGKAVLGAEKFLPSTLINVIFLKFKLKISSCFRVTYNLLYVFIIRRNHGCAYSRNLGVEWYFVSAKIVD